MIHCAPEAAARAAGLSTRMLLVKIHKFKGLVYCTNDRYSESILLCASNVARLLSLLMSMDTLLSVA